MSALFGKRVTRTGCALLSCFVVTLLAGYVVRVLSPNSALGGFLGSAGGVLVAFAGAWLAFVVAWVLLTLAGHPCLADPRASSS
jgi:hypothetical protein